MSLPNLNEAVNKLIGDFGPDILNHKSLARQGFLVIKLCGAPVYELVRCPLGYEKVIEGFTRTTDLAYDWSKDKFVPCRFVDRPVSELTCVIRKKGT